jgi:rhamnosyl/mannosyltransferase
METFLKELVEVQADMGHRVTVLVHGDRPPLGQSDSQKYKVVKAPTVMAILYAPISLAFPLYLYKLINTQKPNIIHFHMPNISAFYALFIPQARKIPWIIHWHSDVIFSNKRPLTTLALRAYAYFERKMLNKAAKVIATSPPYLETSTALSKYKTKTTVIPLGIPKPPIATTSVEREGTDWPETKFRLLAVGRLSHYKGLSYLIEALKRVDDAHLCIVGSGEEYHNLKAAIEESRIEHKISLLGEVSDTTKDCLLRECDALCLPSIERSEAFGLVLLEAMARGKPCIVSDVPGSGMSWVVQHNSTGIVTKTRNSASLADAINSMIHNPETTKTMGTLAQERYTQNFNMDAVADEIDIEYRKVA